MSVAGDNLGNSELLHLWKLDCLRMGRLHFAACEGYSRLRAKITLFNIASSIMMLYFSSNEPSRKFLDNVLSGFGTVFDMHPGLSADVMIGVIAALVVASGAAQGLLRYDERHLEHRTSSYEFYNLAKKIDRLRARGDASNDTLHMINKELNAIRRYSPAVSRRFWEAGDGIQKKIAEIEYK